MVASYAGDVGKTIAVIFVKQVAKFDPDWNETQSTGQLFLANVTKSLQTYTADSTIRQYLLFEPGQAVDPYLVADTERLLRNLDYIEDVKILVVPVSGDDNTVAIIVETRDRWPFGAAGLVKDVGRYEGNLYSSNVGGIGLRWENRLIYRDDREPNFGYGGNLEKGNIGGSFVTGRAEFEDSYRQLHKSVSFERELSHPTIKWVGGISWRRTRERDNGGIADEYELGDVWLGDVIRLYDATDREAANRPVLVPAVLFNRKTFLDRPPVRRDTLRSFHNSQNYLVGLTFQRFKYYKTSYLFEMGETENLPAGIAIKVSGGYQDGQFRDRVQGYFQSSYLATRRRGDVGFILMDIGGFFRDGVYEDGSLALRSGYVTPLLGHHSWHFRFHTVLTYHRAINRTSSTVLKLGESTGLRGMEDNFIAGNQRLIGNFECHVFAPWSIMGFRFMVLGFVDMGVVAGEDDAILDKKIYGSSGLAVRIQNPDLVLDPIEIRVAILNSIDDKGVLVGLSFGGSHRPEIKFPGTRPGGFKFR